MDYNWSEILDQQNISETVIVNTAGAYGIPVTGLKQMVDYADQRALYLVDITDTKNFNTIKTKVPMNHYQIVKCFLTIEYPNTKKETLMFEYSNYTELLFRLGEVVGDHEYHYSIGAFKCVDPTTITSFAKIGDYFDKLVDVSTDLPVKPVRVICLTTNKNILSVTTP